MLIETDSIIDLSQAVLGLICLILHLRYCSQHQLWGGLQGLLIFHLLFTLTKTLFAQLHWNSIVLINLDQLIYLHATLFLWVPPCSLKVKIITYGISLCGLSILFVSLTPLNHFSYSIYILQSLVLLLTAGIGMYKSLFTKTFHSLPCYTTWLWLSLIFLSTFKIFNLLLFECLTAFNINGFTQAHQWLQLSYMLSHIIILKAYLSPWTFHPSKF